MTRRAATRRRATRGALVALAVVGLGAPVVGGQVGAAPDPDAPDAVNPAITAPFSLVAAGGGVDPAVSGNGQYVVYSAAPGTDDGRTSSVWMVNRQDGTATELTLPVDGVRVGNSVHPTISADGCTIAVVTEIPYDLFRDDDRGARWDVYAGRNQACGGNANDWVLVSTATDDIGQAAARNDVASDQAPSVSSAGSAIAYVRPFVSRTGNDDPDRPAAAIDLVDLAVPVDEPTRVTAVPGLPTDAADNGVDYVGHTAPRLSADGTTVVFASDANAELAVATWGTPDPVTRVAPTQIYAWNRLDLDPFTAVRMLSVGGGTPGNASSSDPSVSDDGRVVAFVSRATNLVSADASAFCGTACASQVFVVDRDAERTSLVSHTMATAAALGAETAPIFGNGDSYAPALSGDGISVAFATKATDLLPVQAPGSGAPSDGDVIVADLSTSQAVLRRGFDSLTPAPAVHGHPQLSANGRVLVVDSAAAGDILGDPSIIGRTIVAARFQPALSIASLDLGTGLVGRASQGWEVNIINLGPGAINPVITIDNPDFSIVGGSCMDGVRVKAGSSCSISLLLTPSVVGAITGNLIVAEEGFDPLLVVTPLRGAGGEPALSSSPAVGDYGTEVVGTVSYQTQTFHVYSVAWQPVWVHRADIAGANPDDFRVVSSTCGDAQLDTDAGCDVEVSFRPTAAGRRTATLSFSTVAGQYTSVLLAGVGVYQPELIAAGTAEPGFFLPLGGSGFPANSEVLLSWSDGQGWTELVTADDTGFFLANLLVSRNQRPGEATLVARTADGVTASTTVLIERSRR